MLKFILQLAALLAGFFVFMFLMSVLMPVLTNPIVFTVIVALIGLFAVKIAVRS